MISDAYNVRIRQARAGGQVSARNLNTLADMLNGMRGENGITVWNEGSGIVIRGSQQQASPRPFGILTITSATRRVTLRAGYIIHGGALVTVTQPSGGVLVAGGTAEAPTYCVLRYVYATGVGSILPATVTGFPLPTAEAWQMPLFAAYLDAGSVKIKEVLWDSVLPLPGIVSSP